MVEDLHKENLDDDLEKGDEDYRNEMGVDGRFLLRNRRRQEYYNVGHGNVKKYAYQHGNIHIQTSEQEKKMTGDEQDLHILGIITTQYSLKQGLCIFDKKSEEDVTKKLTQLHDMKNFIALDPKKFLPVYL